MRWSFLLSTLAGVVASSPMSERSSDIDTTATSVAGYSGPWDRIEHLVKRHRAKPIYISSGSISTATGLSSSMSLSGENPVSSMNHAPRMVPRATRTSKTDLSSISATSSSIELLSGSSATASSYVIPGSISTISASGSSSIGPASSSSSSVPTSSSASAASIPDSEPDAASTPFNLGFVCPDTDGLTVANSFGDMYNVQCATVDDSEDLLELERITRFAPNTNCAALCSIWNQEHLTPKCVQAVFFVNNGQCLLKSSIGNVVAQPAADRVVVVSAAEGRSSANPSTTLPSSITPTSTPRPSPVTGPGSYTVCKNSSISYPGTLSSVVPGWGPHSNCSITPRPFIHPSTSTPLPAVSTSTLPDPCVSHAGGKSWLEAFHHKIVGHTCPPSMSAHPHVHPHVHP